MFVYGEFITDDAVMAAMALSAYAVGLPGLYEDPATGILCGRTARYSSENFNHDNCDYRHWISDFDAVIWSCWLGATSLSGYAHGFFACRFAALRGCIGMMGRIFLATMIMAIFLFVFANFGSGLRHFMPAALWLAGQVIFGGATFFAAAVFFKAIPSGLARRGRH